MSIVVIPCQESAVSNGCQLVYVTASSPIQVLHTTRICNFSEEDGLKAGLDAGAELKASARPGFFMW